MQQDITRTDLAQRLGVSRAAVHDVLNGNTQIVNKNVLAMLDLLGLEIKITKKSEHEYAPDS
jgi:plasmid maintenance system antidote protein VapI